LRVPSHIAEFVNAGDTYNSVRAAFTHHWLRWARAVHARYGDEQKAFALDEDDAVSLLVQVGLGSTREVVSAYFDRADVRCGASALASPEALDAARLGIVDLCCSLADSDLAEALYQFLYAADAEEQHMLPDILEDRRLLVGISDGHYAQVEIDGFVLKALGPKLKPRVEAACALSVEGLSQFQYPHVVKLATPIERDGVPVVHGVDFAGISRGLANARMEGIRRLSNPDDDATQQTRIVMLDERLEQACDVFAFQCVTCTAPPRHEARARLLAEQLALDGNGLADTFRDWYTEMVYQHELGHVRSDDRFVRLCTDHEGLLQSHALDLLLEMSADAFALTALQLGRDDPRRALWSAMKLPSPASLLATGGDDLTSVSSAVFVIRALLEDDAATFLAETFTEAERHLRDGGVEGCERWLLETGKKFAGRLAESEGLTPDATPDRG